MNHAVVFDGREFARNKEEKLLKVLAGLSRRPKLVAMLVGDNPESRLYLKLKEEKARQLGIDFEFKTFSDNQPQEIINFIKEKNDDPAVNGIVLELPLPEKFKEVLDRVKPSKDVDCLTSENLQLLKEGKPRFVPPSVKAVGEILRVWMRSEKWERKKVVVVGGEGAVGKGILSNLSGLSSLRGVDKETKDLGAITKTADVLISATGVGHLIKKEMVKKGAVVIDVGIEKQPNGRLIGDVDFQNVKEVASFITPVPGGVGPVTVICLMENLLESVYH